MPATPSGIVMAPLCASAALSTTRHALRVILGGVEVVLFPLVHRGLHAAQNVAMSLNNHDEATKSILASKEERTTAPGRHSSIRAWVDPRSPTVPRPLPAGDRLPRHTLRPRQRARAPSDRTPTPAAPRSAGGRRVAARAGSPPRRPVDRPRSGSPRRT